MSVEPVVSFNYTSKVRMRCRRSIMRLATHLSPIESFIASPNEYEPLGFIALNSGVQAGADPYILRRVLLAKTTLQDDATRLLFSSQLPFTLIYPDGAKRVLQLPLTAECLDLACPASGKICYVNVVPLLNEKICHGGFDPPDGNPLLFLLCCKADAVFSALGNMFQRPIIGVERLPPLPNPEPSNINEFFFGYKNSTGITYCGGNETAESPTKGGSHARVLVCEAIRQIPGLYIVQEFLTPAEHDAVWEELRGSESNIEIENLARRDVAHFNRRFYYGVNRIGVEGVSVNKQPNFYSWMLQRLRNKDPSVGIRGFPTVAQSQNFDQLTVNFYNFGSCKDKTAPGIAHHVDSHSVFSECVMIVSLGSHTVMEFSHYSKPPDVEEPIGVLLTPRSLLIMTSEARYAWTHSIAEKRVDVLSDKLPRLRRGDRVSLTWRRGRSRPHRREECAWNRLCDGA